MHGKTNKFQDYVHERLKIVTYLQWLKWIEKIKQKNSGVFVRGRVIIRVTPSLKSFSSYQ